MDHVGLLYVCFWLSNGVGVRWFGQLADKLGPGRSWLFFKKSACGSKRSWSDFSDLGSVCGITCDSVATVAQ